MANNYGRQYKKKFVKPPRDRETDLFVEVKSYIPRSLHNLLKYKSEVMNLPVSRLICMAVDNELDQDPAFHYPTPMPTAEYVEGAYAEEAGLIMRYLEKIQEVSQGTGVDMLMLARRDIGIASRDVFMRAFRELLEVQIIEEFKPINPTFKNYSDEYRFVRIKPIEQVKIKRQRYKRPVSV